MAQTYGKKMKERRCPKKTSKATLVMKITGLNQAQIRKVASGVMLKTLKIRRNRGREQYMKEKSKGDWVTSEMS